VVEEEDAPSIHLLVQYTSDTSCHVSRVNECLLVLTSQSVPTAAVHDILILLLLALLVYSTVRSSMIDATLALL
jgi:hypothetical protein